MSLWRESFYIFELKSHVVSFCRTLTGPWCNLWHSVFHGPIILTNRRMNLWVWIEYKMPLTNTALLKDCSICFMPMAIALKFSEQRIPNLIPCVSVHWSYFKSLAWGICKLCYEITRVKRCQGNGQGLPYSTQINGTEAASAPRVSSLACAMETGLST